MLFHAEYNEPQRPPGTGLAEVETGRSSKRSKVKKGALVWALIVILVFVIASFVAHAEGFVAGETVFLNLTVALTSASVGAFIGEHLAIAQVK